jgi:hypothetical protein
MLKVRKGLQIKILELKKKKGQVDPNKELVNEFIKCLKIRSLAPEEFFRVLDKN